MHKYLVALLVLVMLYACMNQSQEESNKRPEIEEVSLEGDDTFSSLELPNLSDHGLFQEPLNELNPVEGVTPYDLATPLFSDYAFKARFVKVPEGKSAKYHPEDPMDFPDNTVLIKNFYYPADFRKPEGDRRILETRLLVKKEGIWNPLAYIWNEEQTDAYLEVAGENIEVSWVHYDGSEQTLNYSVPNLNQCKGCHIKSGVIKPIGPTSRQLNKEFDYADVSANQLEYWQEQGILEELHENVADLDAAPVWGDGPSGSLDKRARAYLDINCAHCHSSEGPANTSGFFVDYYQKEKSALGIMKSPIAAGRGSGGLKYDIHPGEPDSSIIVFRMNSHDPGIMMPELGKKMVHTEGVKLIREWIASMN